MADAHALVATLAHITNPIPADEDDAFMSPWVRVIITSLFINACMFIAELVSFQHKIGREGRQTIEIYAHLAIGPVIFISFLSGPSFTGTLLFYASLWNFCSMTGRGRPSLIVAHPFHRGVTKLEICWWAEALLLLIHHCYLGGAKLAVDTGVIRIGARTLTADLVTLWIAGSAGIHLAHGVGYANLRGAFAATLATFFLRTGAAIAMLTLSAYSEVRDLMILDLCWVTCIITLRYVLWPKPSELSKAGPTESGKVGDVEAPPPLSASACEKTLSPEEMVEQSMIKRVVSISTVAARTPKIVAPRVRWVSATAAIRISQATASASSRRSSLGSIDEPRRSVHAEL